MRITPISAEKANEGGGFTPWKPGDYPFEIHDAADDVSKASGREQLKLTLYVFDPDGNRRTVFDYIGADEKSAWKARHLAEAVGVVQQYEAGELDPFDLVGKTGDLKLRVKPAQGDYPANNAVQDYIAKNGEAKASPRPATLRVDNRPAAPARPANGGTTGGVLDDDSIPFSNEWR
jgi:hypothetical protein